MSILIKGMEMPERGMVVNIYADGRVTNHFDEFGKTIGKAVPVSPHGRLINADALKKKVLMWLPSDPYGKEEKEFSFETDICVSMLMEIEEAETIIEAEE